MRAVRCHFVALTIGIVGLPNVGKSTLFNALTKNDVVAANYPFATIEPNVGVVGVPDSRLAVLSEMFSSEKVLDSGQTVYAAGLDREPLRELFLLTSKPFLYVFNMDEAELASEGVKQEMRDLVAPAEAIFLDAKIEAELVELDDAEALELLQ